MFHSLWIVCLETSRRFELSSRNLGHVMFSFAGTAQEATQHNYYATAQRFSHTSNIVKEDN